MVKKMAAKPLILALANPEPEILPDLAKQARPDAIIATGRSDYPNQVNNVLCFPFIFRGALDVGATTINEAMKLAAVKAIADLATGRAVRRRGGGLRRAERAVRAGVPDPEAVRPAADREDRAGGRQGGDGHRRRDASDRGLRRLSRSLQQFVYHSGLIMKPVFAAAKQSPQRIVYAEGEDERVLRAVQVVVDEGLAKPILIGRPAVIERRIERYGLRMKPGADFELVNPESDPRYRDYWQEYHRLTERRGVSVQYAKIEMRRRAHAHRRDDDPPRRGRRHALRHLRHARPAPALRRPGDRAASPASTTTTR